MKATKNANFNNKMFICAEHLDIDKLIELVKQGANINAINSEGSSVLALVVLASKFDFIKSTLYESFMELVHMKSHFNKIDRMKQLLNITDKELKEGKGSSNLLCEYILRLADITQKERISYLQQLIDAGVVVNLKEKENENSPIVLAILNAECEVVKFLLNHANQHITQDDNRRASFYNFAKDRYKYEYPNLKNWDTKTTYLIDGFDYDMQTIKVRQLKKILNLLKPKNNTKKS